MTHTIEDLLTPQMLARSKAYEHETINWYRQNPHISPGMLVTDGKHVGRVTKMRWYECHSEYWAEIEFRPRITCNVPANELTRWVGPVLRGIV